MAVGPPIRLGTVGKPPIWVGEHRAPPERSDRLNERKIASGGESGPKSRARRGAGGAGGGARPRGAAPSRGA